MPNRFIVVAVLMLFLVPANIACKSLENDTDPETVTDVDSLVEYLRESSVALLDHGPFVSQTMSVTGYAYTPTSGGTLHVFQYPTAGDALTDVAQVDKGRDPRRSPHLYRKDDLVVLYWGDDPRLEQALRRVFGSRIA